LSNECSQLLKASSGYKGGRTGYWANGEKVWKNGIPPVNPIVYNSECVLEEIQEPGRKKKSTKFGKSNSNDVFGFLKDFVNQQEQKMKKKQSAEKKCMTEKCPPWTN